MQIGEAQRGGDTCSSSSIGRASESGSGSGSTVRFESDGPRESEEVESPYKGPLGALDALEESLPIRRGISRFYNGKSKSFGNLTASILSNSNSCKDLGKAETSYTRKRKNLLAFSLMYPPLTEKQPSRSSSKSTLEPSRSSSKSTLEPSRSSSKSTLTSSDSESNISGLEEEREISPLQTPMSKRSKNPVSVFSIHQRSISMMDLKGASRASSPSK